MEIKIYGMGLVENYYHSAVETKTFGEAIETKTHLYSFGGALLSWRSRKGLTARTYCEDLRLVAGWSRDVLLGYFFDIGAQGPTCSSGKLNVACGGG